jgi:thiosulfate/3-mercaptopyruvate sulfurtransferase
MSQLINSYELNDLLECKDICLLDVRPCAAYNGWPLEDEERGGHIPTAISFPLSWFKDLPENKVISKLEEKKIAKDKPIIVTGYNKLDNETLASHLASLGYSDIRIHLPGMLEWISDKRLPLNYLPRYRHLVHPEWLKQLLDGRNPANEKIEKFILAHVNFDNWGDYDEGHISGSIWLDTLTLEDEETWNCRTPEELEEELRTHGISCDTTVILYGRTNNPDMSQDQPGKQAGQLASMRAASLLLYAGIKDVRVMDGGLDAWIRAGGLLTRKETQPTPVEKTGLNIPENSEFIVDTEMAKQMLSDKKSELVSIRSWYEFTGKVSGYHYIEPSGCIPGAIFGNCGSDAYHMENYRNHDDTMRSNEEITAYWKELGIVPEKHIAFYCGTGWRASEAFFCAWLMWWKNISVYDGGWYEWSADPKNPIETGDPHL